MSEESATVVAAAEVPNDIYVGTNVVRRHIFDFFDLAANQGLLIEGEQVLAMFDCVILEESGRRLGGLTLHDYAILTNRNLITWGRGRSKDIVDKFPWRDIALDKYGRRNPIEGVVKVLYKTRATGNGRKRKISIRSSDTDAVVTPATSNVGVAKSSLGVALYLDLMPAGDVRPCVEMMRYLMGVSNGVPSVDGFQAHFRNDIVESQERLSRVALVLQPFYVDAGNGILVEADPDEEFVYRNVPRRYRDRAERAQIQPAERGRVNPYTGPDVSAKRGVVSPYRGTTGRRATTTRPTAASTNRTGNVAVSMDVTEAPSSGGMLNRGNRNTSTGAPGKINQGAGSSTVSLGNQPYSGPSKLDSYERRGTGGSSKLGGGEAVLRPAPAPRPAPEPRPAPAARTEPVPSPYTSASADRERQLTPPVVDRLFPERAEFNRPLAIPIGVAIPKDALNVYNVSRLARGLWLQPQNLMRNATDLSDTVAVLGDLTNLIATDAETRRMAINRIKYAVDRGPLARNLILHYTIWPFIKPVVDLVAMQPADATSFSRVYVRTTNDTVEQVEDLVGDADLPDMGMMTASDKPEIRPAGGTTAAAPTPMPQAAPAATAKPVPMPQAKPVADTPPVPMPKVTPPAPQHHVAPPPPVPTSCRVVEQKAAEPIPPKRQPIGDLGLGAVTFDSPPSKLGNNAPPPEGLGDAPKAPDKPQPKSKLGEDL